MLACRRGNTEETVPESGIAVLPQHYVTGWHLFAQAALREREEKGGWMTTSLQAAGKQRAEQVFLDLSGGARGVDKLEVVTLE